jgi:hypothetical protein
MSEERDPELEMQWDAILAKRGLAMVGPSLAAGGIIGAVQGAEYRLHEPGLTTNPTRAYVEGWITRQQADAERRQNDQYHQARRLNQRTYWAAVAGVVVGIIAAMTGMVALLK